jgi:hypothetical protein
MCESVCLIMQLFFMVVGVVIRVADSLNQSSVLYASFMTVFTGLYNLCFTKRISYILF